MWIKIADIEKLFYWKEFYSKSLMLLSYEKKGVEIYSIVIVVIFCVIGGSESSLFWTFHYFYVSNVGFIKGQCNCQRRCSSIL